MACSGAGGHVAPGAGGAARPGARVAVIPGTTFGLDGCALRVWYGALEPETVEAGIRRLVDGLAAILLTGPSSRLATSG